MEALLTKDDSSYYEDIIDKYNTEIQQKRIELSVEELLNKLNK